MGHLGAVHDGRMVELVQEDHVAAADQTRDQAEVRLIAGREDEAGFLTEEFRQLQLELLVQIEGAVEEPAAGAPRAIAGQGLLRGRQHFRMMGEPQVVVGAHHDPVSAFDDDDGVFRAGDRLEIGVQSRRLHLARLRETLAFVEERNVLQGFRAHAASISMKDWVVHPSRRPPKWQDGRAAAAFARPRPRT